MMMMMILRQLGQDGDGRTQGDTQGSWPSNGCTINTITVSERPSWVLNIMENLWAVGAPPNLAGGSQCSLRLPSWWGRDAAPPQEPPRTPALGLRSVPNERFWAQALEDGKLFWILMQQEMNGRGGSSANWNSNTCTAPVTSPPEQRTSYHPTKSHSIKGKTCICRPDLQSVT